MKLPGFLLIGLAAIIIAVDAQGISTTHYPKKTEVTGTSVHGLTKPTEKLVTGTSVHNLLKKTEKPITGSSVHHLTATQKPITGSSVHHLTGTQKPITGSSVHHLTGTQKPITGSSVRHLTVTENPLGQSEKKVIGYYLNTDQYRPGNAKFLPEMIDPTLFTHLVYASAILSDDLELIPTDPKDVGPNGGYAQLNKLMEKNPNLKTMISVGGQNNSVEEFTNMIKNQATRLQFINSTMTFLEIHNFSGICWDIFHNASVENVLEVKDHIVDFLKEFKKESEDETKKTEKLLMTMIIPADENIIEAIDLKDIVNECDWIQLRTFGMLNESLRVTQLHSALYPGNNTDEKRTMDWMVKRVLSLGVPKEKLVAGMPTLGFGYELEDAKNYKIGAPVVGLCPPGEFTSVYGQRGFFEICSMMNDSSIKKVFLEEQKVYVVSNETMWLSYDDVESMEVKANYVKEEGLGGVFIWNLGSDDFSGNFCNLGPYPLIRALFDTLMGGVTGKVRGTVTGSLPPLTKILESRTTFTHKMETTTIKK